VVSHWRIVVAALVIFGAGVLTGAVGTGLASRVARERRVVARPQTNGTPAGLNLERALPKVRNPGAFRLEQLSRLARELNLTPEQLSSLEVLVGSTESRLRDIWKPVLPGAKSEVDDFDRRLQEILSPEQRARMAQMLQKRSPPRPTNP
jgi:hypothetical protein